MYGLMFNILREMVIGEYGEHYWKDICVKSGITGLETGVLAKELYDESQMTSLLATTADILGVELEALLELFGEQFFRNIKHSGHYKVVSCLGNTLEGFLLNLDTLHDHLTLAYPKMRPLSFRAEKTQTGLLLHYFSTRKGFYPMAIGLVKMVAKEFYHLMVEVELMEEVVDEGAALPYHYKLSIEMLEGRKDCRALGRLRGNSVVPDLLSLPSSRPSTAEIPHTSPDSPVAISPQLPPHHAPQLPPHHAPQLPPHHAPQLPPHHAPHKEERSQSMGQILRERSGGHSIPAGLTPSAIAELSRLCPHLSDLREEDGEEEDKEDGEKDTELPAATLHPSLPTPSPHTSPLLHRSAAVTDGDDAIFQFLRRGSSQSSLVGGLPPSLLPTLSTSASRLPLTTPRLDSALSFSMTTDVNWPITKSLFQICFPFHIIFDTSLVIRYMGVSMARLLPDAITNEDKITDHFNLLRPIGTFNYQTIRCSIHNPFILATKQNEKSDKKALQFRGQMVPVINSDSCPILFIGSPRIETVEDLQLKGLYLTDLPIHDVTRDLILMSHHFQAEVNVAFQLEVTKRELEMEKRKVQEEKQRADRLLHAMLPPSVTRELTSGGDHNQMVVAEEVASVTILFSDIRDFTTICHRCSPMDVVSMLNDLYTKFDSYIDRHKVYKVETIGDAYMVAAGLLDTSKQPAEAVTNMAFDMREAASLVTTPHTNDSIQIRIGIHSGTVVAGVVGTKMPRYCLFGDTVNTASRMESHGEAGHVHISQMTYRKLRGRPYIFWNRGRICIKGLPEPMQTYYVEPGEEHELSETMTIRVAVDRAGESDDSDWEETQVESNTFLRQKRLPSFVRYKHMQVVAPTPIPSADPSLSSILGDNGLARLSNRRRKSSVTSPPNRSISPRPPLPTMKERLAGKLSLGSIGSFSLSQGLTSFIEHDEGTYREMGIDLPHAQLTVETNEEGRKLSSGSGMLITVEPEGKSVTFTREQISVCSSPSSTAPEEYEEEEEEDGEEDREERRDMGHRCKSEGTLVRPKKRKLRKLSVKHKNKCKVS